MNAKQYSRKFLNITRYNTISNNIDFNSTILRNFTILAESENWGFSDVIIGIFLGGVLGISVGGGACVMSYTGVKCSDRAREAGRFIDDYNENDTAEWACIFCRSIFGTITAIVVFIQSKEISGNTNKNRLLESENEGFPNDNYNDLALEI